ncbi:MAG: hypothetical protein ACXVAM_19090 [Vulcanimicrobiaceae bacterium]
MSLPLRVKARVSAHGTFGDVALRYLDYERLLNAGRTWSALAFRMIVGPRLCIAQHCFKGLNRSVGSDPKGENFWIYSFNVPYNVIYDQGTQKVKVIDPPPGSVFMVIVEPTSDEVLSTIAVYGWISSWSWVLEDQVVQGAPVNPDTRFGRKLWSSGQA